MKLIDSCSYSENTELFFYCLGKTDVLLKHSFKVGILNRISTAKLGEARKSCRYGTKFI